MREATQLLALVSDTHRLDAELLMAHALGVSRSDMLLRAMRDAVPEGFEALVARRLAWLASLARVAERGVWRGRSLRPS